MSWDWAYAWDSVPELLDAFGTTLLATALASVLPLVLGLAIALVERFGRRSVVARIVGMVPSSSAARPR
jgi:polar amino acid transport system permease protein